MEGQAGGRFSYKKYNNPLWQSLVKTSIDARHLKEDRNPNDMCPSHAIQIIIPSHWLPSISQCPSHRLQLFTLKLSVTPSKKVRHTCLANRSWPLENGCTVQKEKPGPRHERFDSTLYWILGTFRFKDKDENEYEIWMSVFSENT